MKIVWRLVVILIIVVPIFMCWKTLQKVWEEPDDSYTSSGDNSEGFVLSGDLREVENLIHNEEERVTASNLGDGVKYDVTGINIISKVYENAEVAISLANIYEDHDETSNVVAKLEKGSLITVQNYDNGWSTVTNYANSGWMKTENIKLPDEDSNMELIQTTGNEKIGTVKVDDSLNVRASASRTADIIGSLSNGTVVTILETSDGWYKVKVKNITGWVSADYVTVN